MYFNLAFLYDDFTGSWAHGHCIHPAFQLMEAGTAQTILHRGSQRELPDGWAFSESLAFCSPVPFPLCHFRPSGFDNVRQIYLKVKVVRLAQQQKCFGICHSKEEVTLKTTILLERSKEKRKWRLSCQRLNAMKMSEPYLFSQGSLKKTWNFLKTPMFISKI